MYQEHVNETREFNNQARRTNLYNQMKCPDLIGNLNNVSYNSLTKIINNIQSYGISYPLSGWNPDVKSSGLDETRFYRGPDYSLSSNFFEKMGTCDPSTSEPVCANQDRYVYIRNIPTGSIPFFNNVSFQGLTGCNLEGLTESRGILNGILEDVSDIQLKDIMDAYGKKGNYGTSQCKLMTFPVGSHIYDDRMKDKTWKPLSRCTSSWSNLKPATDGRSQLYPGASSFQEVESFTNPSSHDIKKILFVFLVYVIFIIAISAYYSSTTMS
jgi:hypothetical protein